MSLRDDIIKHDRRFLSTVRPVFLSAGNILTNEMLLAVHKSKSHPSEGGKCIRRENVIGAVVFVCMYVDTVPVLVLSNVLFVDYVKS
jgi:hypothetical protein